METRVAGVTVRVVEPDMLPDTALIVVDPAAAEVATPVEFIVATAVSDELHVTEEVKS